MIPGLNKTLIQKHSNLQSYEKGEDYYEMGSVISVIQRGNALSAQVEGSEYEPYAISVRFDQGGLLEAQCSCPYDWGGWCKHIVATLLTCLEMPDTVSHKPMLEESLKNLDANQLRELMQTIVFEFPQIHEIIDDYLDSHVNTATASTSVESTHKPQRQTPVDSKSIRKQVSRILAQAHEGYYDRDYYWDDYEIPGLDKVREILGKTNDFLENGDGCNALIMVQAVTDAWMEAMEELEDAYGTDEDFMDDLAQTWAEAILTSDLSVEERDEWRDILEDYDGDYFGIALIALEQGWDFPPLIEVLKGNISNKGIWGTQEVPYFADDLAIIRLRILERQKRYEDYLNLAEAEGQSLAWLLMLARLGQVEKAVKAGLQQLFSDHEAFSLAKALREKERLEEALQIAEHGLKLEGSSKKELASWTAELAKGMGLADRAFQAALQSFKARPSLQDYLDIQQQVSAEEWPAYQKQLLDITRSYPKDFFDIEKDQTDIFLHEGLWDDAIKVISDASSYQSEIIQRVMDTVLPHRPEWIAENAKARAERIMDGGKANYYHFAVEWLRRTKEAYQKMERFDEWMEYYHTVRQTHSRKYKLMGLLKLLG